MGLDIFIQSLHAGQLPSSKGTLYTVPADSNVVVKTFDLSNTSGVDQLVNIYIKRSGGTSRLISPKNFLFQSGDKAEFSDEAICLAAGDIIEGECVGAATAVDVTLTGVVNQTK